MRDRTELRKASIAIAACIMAELTRGRIQRADIDNVRCGIAGWMAHDEMPLNHNDMTFFEEQTLRQLIQLVG